MTKLKDAAAEVPNDVKMETREVNVYYGDNHAIRNVDFDIIDRSVTALIGPSGCGKSTYLRALNRMNDTIDICRVEGRILLDGENIYDRSVDPVEVRRRVGMVFQKSNPFPKSIFDNVAFGLRIGGEKDKDLIAQRVEESLKGAALWEEVKDTLHKRGTFLSGGQQQRLCIARALAMKPEILLLDEPSSALDPKATAHIEELISELKQDVTIIMVTHNIAQAARISDFTTFIYLGEMVEYGTTEKMFTVPKDKRTEEYLTGKFG